MSDHNPDTLDALASLARLEHVLGTLPAATSFEQALAAASGQLGDKLEEYLRARWGNDAEMIEQAMVLRARLRRGQPIEPERRVGA